MLLHSVFLFGISFASNAVKINMSSSVYWVAPDKWDETPLESHVKNYWHVEWAKAWYDPGCADETLKIIPVYFWPDERVDLECRMCELAFVFNGHIKRWAKATNILEFIVNPQNFVSTGLDYEMVKNYRDVEDLDIERQNEGVKDDYLPYDTLNDMRGKNYLRGDPVYLQRSGKLSIMRASSASQGVYFCMDKDSKGSTSLFYVLSAMLPPVTLPTDDRGYTDNCAYDDERAYPSQNWRYHFMPSARPRKQQCKNTKKPETCLLVETFEPLPEAVIDYDESTKCSMEFCRNTLRLRSVGSTVKIEAGAIELRWTPWTKCGNGATSRTREGHCWLMRRAGQDFSTSALDTIQWLERLNELFNKEPFASDGIKLHSSLIVSTILGVDTLRGCITDKAKSKLYHRVWEHLFLLTMGSEGRENAPTENLTPFQGCVTSYVTKEKKFLHSARNQVIIGTYMVETEACPV